MAASEILVTNGATPATPAAGKSKLFVNASKQMSMVDEGGVVTVLGKAPAIAQTSPSDPTGTTNSTGLMMGLAGALTPVYTGRVLIMLSGTIANASGIADGANVQLRYGTGSAPANADALTGTTVGGLVKYVSATTAEKAPFALQGIVTGLTLATAIWVDVGLAAVTGGTATIKDLSLTIMEI
jgi:hypothetical protein